MRGGKAAVRAKQPAGVGAPARARRPAAARSAGTRERLIEIAGQVFAERGFDGATGQDICRRAGTHTAAIVYHFGGIAGLYRAVLEEARRRLIPTEAIAAAVEAESDPRRKLEAFLGMIVQAVTSPVSQTWAGRVLGREFVTPSIVYGQVHDRELAARTGILRSIVAELTGLRPQRPPGGALLHQHDGSLRAAAIGRSAQTAADAARTQGGRRVGAAAHPASGRFCARGIGRDRLPAAIELKRPGRAPCFRLSYARPGCLAWPVRHTAD